MGVFILFLLSLTSGVLSTGFWVPGDDLGRGYFQTNALIVLGLLGLSLTTVLLHPIEAFPAPGSAGTALLVAAFVFAFLYYGAIWRERWRLARLPAALALAMATAALLLSASHLVPTPTPLPYRGALEALAMVSCSLLLGWSLVTMLLGHWYLVVPRLTFRHLTVFCRVLVAVVLLRMLAVLTSLAAAWSVDPFTAPHPWRMLVSLGGQGMFFWFRLSWGLAIPLLLALMALHCARNRSNQSATGILYVLLVGSFIGEITALYLALTTGVPV